MADVEANKRLEERTLTFAVMSVKYAGTLPATETGRIVERQLVRATTSIGSNYREANRAESREDFVHKSAIVLKEAAESTYWIELCERLAFGEPTLRDKLSAESRELLAIFTTINRKAKIRS